MLAAMLVDGNPWVGIKDGDRRALALYRRHYSARTYRDRREHCRFVGPGQRVALMTSDCAALLVWRVSRRLDGQTGICCSIFRNEGPALSSDLLIQGEAFAWERWPDETRLFTHVDPTKIQSDQPGYCFLMAGWTGWGWTRSGLRILEKCR